MFLKTAITFSYEKMNNLSENITSTDDNYKKALLEKLKLLPCKWEYTFSRLKGTHKEYQLWKALFDT